MCPLGALSGARDSWEYYSGARDLQSSDIQPQQTQTQQQPAILQKLLEQPGTVLEQQAALHKLLAQTSTRCAPLEGNYLELANTVSGLLLVLSAYCIMLVVAFDGFLICCLLNYFVSHPMAKIVVSSQKPVCNCDTLS